MTSLLPDNASGDKPQGIIAFSDSSIQVPSSALRTFHFRDIRIVIKAFSTPSSQSNSPVHSCLSKTTSVIFQYSAQ